MEGLECISPQQLKDMNNCFVIIMIYSTEAVQAIVRQLKKLGMKNYITITDVMNMFD
jgi:sulfur relay (sulfurtransferase) DsrF/TusC family protein